MVNKSKCKQCGNYFVRDINNPIEALGVKFDTKKCRQEFIRAKANKQKDKIKARKVKAKVKKSFSRSKLTKEADRVWSIYIRQRDRGNPCITCNTEWTDTVQAGHFQSRRHLNTRWEKLNGAGQCVKCNNWGSGEQYAFAKYLDNKTPGLADKLTQLANNIEKTTDEEILEYIRLYYRLLAEMGFDNEFIKVKKMYLQ